MSDLHTFHWPKQVTCQCPISRLQKRAAPMIVLVVTDTWFNTLPEAIHLSVFTYVISKSLNLTPAPLVFIIFMTVGLFK